MAGAALLVAVLAGHPVHAGSSDMQRMALAPGCYVLPPQGYQDVGAYCLDQSRHAPRWGALLPSVPAALDGAAIKDASGARMSLAAALAQHALQVQGLGTDLELRLRNLTDRAIELCVDSPTVVMGNGESDVSDLAGIRDRIARVLKLPVAETSSAYGGSDPLETMGHLIVQQKLWEAVNRARGEQGGRPTDANPSGPLPPPRPLHAPSTTPPDQAKCVGRAGTARICTE